MLLTHGGTAEMRRWPVARRKQAPDIGTEDDARQWVDMARYFLRPFAPGVEQMNVNELREIARGSSFHALRFLDNSHNGVPFGYRQPEVVYPPGTPVSELRAAGARARYA
jgi:hypothetical protein